MGKNGNKGSDNNKRRAAKRAKAEKHKKQKKQNTASIKTAPLHESYRSSREVRFRDDREPEAFAISRHGKYNVIGVGNSADEVAWLTGGVQRFGDALIVKPEKVLEMEYRDQAAKNFLSLLPVGEYTDAKIITKAFNQQAIFIGSLMDDVLMECGDANAIEFLLFQHDQWTIAEGWARKSQGKFSKGSLEHRKASWVLENYPLARRALKTLIERAVQRYDGSLEAEEIDDTEKFVRCVERAIVLAEELTKMFIFSDMTYRLFPDSTTLEVREPDENDIYFILRSEEGERLIASFRERYRRWASNNDPTVSADIPSESVVEALDSQFKAELGFGVRQIFGVIDQMKTQIIPQGTFLGAVPLGDLVKLLSANLELDPTKVEAIIRGWCLREGNIDWKPHKPKRVNRMLTRPVVMLEKYPEGTVVIAPKEIAAETATMALDLWRRRGFLQLPPEWGATEKGGTVKGLDKYAHAMDTQLERVTATALGGIGFCGLNVSTNTLSPEGVVVPSHIGEIDYLGCLPNNRVLLVIENKNLLAATDPAGFEEEVAEFEEGYIPQVMRKFDWVLDNSEMILSAMGERFGFTPDSGDWRIAPVIVTSGEHFIADQRSDVHISSLALLLEDIKAGAMTDLQWRHRVVVR